MLNIWRTLVYRCAISKDKDLFTCLCWFRWMRSWLASFHTHCCVFPCRAEADPGARQQQPVSGQGQRGGQPGAQCQRLHTFTLPTVAAPQRHTTWGLLTTLRTLASTHTHTHAAAQSKQSVERTCFLTLGTRKGKTSRVGIWKERRMDWTVLPLSEVRGRSVFDPQ